MIEVEYRFCTAMDCAFMPTSIPPCPNPNTNNTATKLHRFGARASTGSKAAAISVAVCVTRWLPNRAHSPPASGMATSAPPAIASNASPNTPSFRPNPALTDGMRATQLPVSMPLMKNISATATRNAVGTGGSRRRTTRSAERSSGLAFSTSSTRCVG